MERHAQRHRRAAARCRSRPTCRWPDSQLILAEASYDYTPIVGYTITGTLKLSDKMYMGPRITAPSYNGTACAS